MGQLAARLTDMHTCPLVTALVPHVGGPIAAFGAITVLTGHLPQARVTDICVCVGPPDPIVKGSTGVFAEKLPCARLGDTTAHGGVIVMGMPTVLIGETGGGGGGDASGGMLLAFSGSAAMGQPGAQAKAMIGANQQGSYFCRRCWEDAQR